MNGYSTDYEGGKLNMERKRRKGEINNRNIEIDEECRGLKSRKNNL